MKRAFAVPPGRAWTELSATCWSLGERCSEALQCDRGTSLLANAVQLGHDGFIDSL